MKKLINSLLLLSTVIASTSIYGVENLSANVAATNNYLWRGVTQTTNSAAISGGIDYQTTSGFSVGAWTSNADWAENMSYELDLYASYANELSNGLGYSLGYIYYAYDSDANSNFSEINLSLSYDAYSLTYNTLVDSDAGGNFGDDNYIAIATEFELSNELALGFHIGYYDFNDGVDYTDFAISLSKGGFTFSIADTDLNNADGDINFIIAYELALDL